MQSNFSKNEFSSFGVSLPFVMPLRSQISEEEVPKRSLSNTSKNKPQIVDKQNSFRPNSSFKLEGDLFNDLA
jgi:hypothetical protein